VVQALNDIRFSSQMDRVKCKPWGLEGGHSGFGNSVALHRYGQIDETHFPNGKALNQVLKPGDAYILRSGGGGGFGSPLERDLGKLEHDVRCDYVSRDAAQDLYGAVFCADGRIDQAATVQRRAEMKARGLPIDQPIAKTVAPLPFTAEAVGSASVGDKLTEEERIALAMNCRCCS
jgi:N-methylhydantoinase B